MNNEVFTRNDIVMLIDEENDIELMEAGSVTGVMQVVEVQGDEVLVKFLNESGTYNFSTIDADKIFRAV